MNGSYDNTTILKDYENLKGSKLYDDLMKHDGEIIVSNTKINGLPVFSCIPGGTIKDVNKNLVKNIEGMKITINGEQYEIRGEAS